MANALPILTKGGEKKGEATLSPGLFGIEPNEHVMYEAVKAYLANQRSGAANTKGRSDVRGGGRKPWRQKGSGRARAGSTRVSHWVGGGLAFGPKPRDHSLKIPKKVKRLALKSALSTKAAEGGIMLIEHPDLSAVSTKEMAGVLKAIGIDRTRKALLVLGRPDVKIFLSARNIPNVKVMMAPGINAYHLLRADVVVMTEDALAKVEEVFGE